MNIEKVNGKTLAKPSQAELNALEKAAVVLDLIAALEPEPEPAKPLADQLRDIHQVFISRRASESTGS